MQHRRIGQVLAVRQARGVQDETEHQCDDRRGTDLFVCTYVLNYAQMLMGHPPLHKRLVYRRANDRISALVTTFYNRNPIDFLRGIAHNFEMLP